MKDYKSLSEICNDIIGDCKPCKPQENALTEIINVIESGELCDREEVRKETAREFLSKIIEICKREEAFQDGHCNTQLAPLYLGIANGCAFIREKAIELMKEVEK